MSSFIATAAFAHEPSPQSPPVWQKVTDLPAVRGMDGQTHSATCSGFPGTDAKFAFWARKGKSKNLAIYFEGGGACWDGLTCSLPMAARA